jgi:hypothetical protein
VHVSIAYPINSIGFWPVHLGSRTRFGVCSSGPSFSQQRLLTKRKYLTKEELKAATKGYVRNKEKKDLNPRRKRPLGSNRKNRRQQKTRVVH